MLEVFLLLIEFCISAPQCSDSLDDATSISASHFFNCSRLPSSIYNNGVLTIPSNIKSIGPYAFSGTPITSVIVNSNVENLSPYAFEDCEQLTSITILPRLGQEEILGLTLAPNLNKLIVNGKTILDDKIFNVPEEWFDSIPDFYFSGSEFEVLSLPSSYGDQENWSLGNWAFSNCPKLKKVEIKFELLDLPSGSFYNCPSLTEIIIGGQNVLKDQVVSFSTIDEIGSYVFSNLTPITTVIFSDRNYILDGRIIESSFLVRIKFVAKPLKMQFADIPPFEGCLNLKDVEFPSENYKCENFEEFNFTIFAQGSSLARQEGWCDTRSFEPVIPSNVEEKSESVIHSKVEEKSESVIPSNVEEKSESVMPSNVEEKSESAIHSSFQEKNDNATLSNSEEKNDNENTSNVDEEENTSLSTGAIVAIVLGCVALVAALTVTIYCFCSNKKEDEYQDSL